jgi:hypothetical protein
VTSAYGSTTSLNGFTCAVALIFVTSATYNGNLGGFASADRNCTTDASKPAAGSAASYTSKALLSGNNAATNGVSYYRPDGTTLIASATGGNLAGANSLTNSGSTSNPRAWTGAANAAGCTLWTDATLGNNTRS